MQKTTTSEGLFKSAWGNIETFEKQLELVAKAEHRYRGQIAHKQHLISKVLVDDCLHCKKIQKYEKMLKSEVA